MNEPVRVVLIDDHELIRQGLAMSFGVYPDLEVVGQAGDVQTGIAAYHEHQPDVVVTDLQLPDGTGFDIIRQLRKESATVGLVMLTMFGGDDQIFAALGAGASGFVGKDAPTSEVVTAARHSAKSPRTFICTGLTEAMIRQTNKGSSRLTDREHDVLLGLSEGLSSAQIAKTLFISESTVKSHVGNVYQKLGATNRAQALVTAMRRGLLTTMTRED